MGTQPLLQKGRNPTQFSAHVYCGQLAGWMKTPLGTEVALGPGHIVLDGVPAPAKGAQQPPPLFSAHVYCGHVRPSQLLLSSCTNGRPINGLEVFNCMQKLSMYALSAVDFCHRDHLLTRLQICLYLV